MEMIENEPAGDQQFKLIGYVTPNSFPPNKGAEHIYVVDEEGFDGCTVPIYIKENQNEQV